MAKKKSEQPMEPTPPHVMEDFNEVLSTYVDPTNTLAVRVEGTYVIVNVTQVEAKSIEGLMKDLEPLGYTVLLASCHPSEFKFPE